MLVAKRSVFLTPLMNKVSILSQKTETWQF
jgi:hypothetical protein